MKLQVEAQVRQGRARNSGVRKEKRQEVMLCLLWAAAGTYVCHLTPQISEEVGNRIPILQMRRLRLREATTCLRPPGGHWWSWH